MPQLTRKGAVIQWEERGEGPGVFIAHSMISMPSDFDALLGQLASDHRVVTYDPRGAGKSSRAGPYDITTDAEDMAAVIEEAGHPVVAVALGYNPVPLGVVTTRPELVEAVVLVGPPRLGSREGAEDVSLLESDAVVEVMLEMMESNPRGLLRTLISMGNPQLSEAEVHERLEQQLAYGPPEVGVERARRIWPMTPPARAPRWVAGFGSSTGRIRYRHRMRSSGCVSGCPRHNSSRWRTGRSAALT